MKKNKYFLVLLSLAFLFNSNAQSWQWGRAATGTGIMEGWGTAIDTSKNVYLTGIIENGACIIGSYTLTTVDGDAYLIKLDSAGNVLWAKQSVVTLHNVGYGYAVATDKYNNAYLTGYFDDSLLFGLYKLKAKTANEFLVKYDVNGNVKWAKQSVTSSAAGQGIGYSDATDNNGNIFVVGYFYDTIYFGLHQLLSVSNSILLNTFIVKYDSSGNVLWAKQSTSPKNGQRYGLSVATDKKGYAFVTGFFEDSVTFGAYKLYAPGSDMFVVKYDPGGNVIWAKQSTNPSTTRNCRGDFCTVDVFGNIYVTGVFTNTVDFGASTLTSSAYGTDFYIAKFDSNGNTLWGKQSNSLDSNDWNGWSLGTDTSGNIYLLAGGGVPSISPHDAKLKFGTETFYLNRVSDPSLVLKLDSSGNAICGSLISGGGDDMNGIAVDQMGKYIYLGGDVRDTITFGPNKIGPSLSSNTEDAFAVRWQPCHNINEGVFAIEEQKPLIIIYPNPNNGSFTVSLSTVSDKCTIEIFNVLGEKVYSQLSTFNSPLSINLSNQPNGVYFYRVLQEDGSLIGSGKVVVEKP